MRRITIGNQETLESAKALPQPRSCITEISIFALLGLASLVAMFLWLMIAAVL